MDLCGLSVFFWSLINVNIMLKKKKKVTKGDLTFSVVIVIALHQKKTKIKTVADQTPAETIKEVDFCHREKKD